MKVPMLPKGAVLAVALLAQAHEPQVNLIHAFDVLGQKRLIGVCMNGRFMMTSLEIMDNMVKLIDLGVHDTEIAHDADFVDRKRAAAGAAGNSSHNHRRETLDNRLFEW